LLSLCIYESPSILTDLLSSAKPPTNLIQQAMTQRKAYKATNPETPKSNKPRDSTAKRLVMPPKPKLFFTEPLSSINGVIATLNPQGTEVHESFDDEEKKVVFPAASEDVEEHLGIDMCKIPHQTRGTDFYIWRGAVLSAGYDPTASSEQTVLYIRAVEDLARENSVARDCFKDQALAAKNESDDHKQMVSALNERVATLTEQLLQRNNQLVDLQSAMLTAKKNESDDHKQMVSALDERVATLTEQLLQRNNQPVDLQSAMLTAKTTGSGGSPGPVVDALRSNDITLPTFDGEMDWEAVHSFLVSLERCLRAANLLSFGVEVPADDTIWGAQAILQLRDSNDPSKRAAEWANGIWKPSGAKPTWAQFKKALQERFIRGIPEDLLE
jgi:polyhydroxyalkanoate synthesis regulator phasin